MSHYMPPALLALFAPRPPITFKAPVEKRSNCRPQEGIAQYVQCFTHPSLQQPVEPTETPAQRREKRKLARAEANKAYIAQQLETCTRGVPFPFVIVQCLTARSVLSGDPKSSIVSGDAMKTLFVGRLVGFLRPGLVAISVICSNWASHAGL